jgi:mxaA protein
VPGFLAALPLLWAQTQAAAGAPNVRLETPAPYGYSIGDVIRHTIAVDLPAGSRVDPASLPKPGAVNRWLELRRADLEPGAAGFTLRLEYQTFYAPLEVKPLKIPGFMLRFTGGDGAAAAEVPAWTFTMAPLHGLSLLAGEGLAPLQPDRGLVSPGAGTHGLRALGLLAGGAGLVLAFAYLDGRLGGRGRRGRQFQAARRELARLRAAGHQTEALRAGFSAVHRAFDLTQDGPLFAERLPEFFAARPAYDDLRGEVEAFFQASYALFFGTGEPDPAFGFDRLDRLCRACRQAERGRP